MKIWNFALAVCLYLVHFNSLQAQDTVVVRSHNQTHWNWYGNWDNWTVFPGDTFTSRKILLKYTLGCPGSGCSEWDYTTQIKVLHPNGETDSSLTQSPWFVSAGSSPDSIPVLITSPWVTFYNSTTQLTDSSLATADTVFVFADSAAPTLITDTVLVFTGGFWNYYFDATGTTTDSVWVGYDSLWNNGQHTYYQYFPKIVTIELARFITPYAGSVPNSWTRTVYYDVTDYAPVLRDSTLIRAHYGGWQNGFTITLDFMFIEGTPPRNSLDVIPIYDGNYNYGGAPGIETSLTSKTVNLPVGTDAFALHFTPTGHGFDNNEDCAEFCPKTYTVKVNGSVVQNGLIWNDECGLNPQYPQSGTWLYDRANWCPGDKGRRFEHELTGTAAMNQPVSIDVDIQPYTWNGSGGQPVYIIHGSVIPYSTPNFTTDAEIRDILAPSKFYEYRRFNPICDNAHILVRNSGSATITEMVFSYQVEGGTPAQYIWTGSLPFLAETEVQLPFPDATFWQGSGNTFMAEILSVNGSADQNADNNKLQSEYDLTPSYAAPAIIILMKTNLFPGENAWEILDSDGNVVYSRNNFPTNDFARDTVPLANGCYTFHLTDSDKDGMAFWANSDGSGYARIMRHDGMIYKNFSGDFGTEITHHFTVGYANQVVESEHVPHIEMYPNPASHTVTLDLSALTGTSQVTVFGSDGKQILNGSYSGNLITLDVSEFANGLYFLKVSNNNRYVTKQLILSH